MAYKTRFHCTNWNRFGVGLSTAFNEPVGNSKDIFKRVIITAIPAESLGLILSYEIAVIKSKHNKMERLN